MAGVPPLDQIFPQVATTDLALQYLIDHGVIDLDQNCVLCQSGMTLRREKLRFRCRRYSCRNEQSVFMNTLFAGGPRRLPCNDVLKMACMWLSGATYSVIMNQTGKASPTVTRWIRLFKRVVQLDLDDEDNMIGGEGIIVEVDESKFGKRKYNRGHRVEGVWVVGGVERTEARGLFAVTVRNRNAQTLKDVIEAHVLPGSIVYTDCWRGYRNEDLAEIGMGHDTVNHTYNFVDPVTGVHTNHMEGTWSALKWTAVPVRHRHLGEIDGDICKFIWKRKHQGNLWNAFLAAVNRVVFDDDVNNAINEEDANPEGPVEEGEDVMPGEENL